MTIGRVFALAALLGISGCAQDMSCACPIPGRTSGSTITVTPECFEVAPTAPSTLAPGATPVPEATATPLPSSEPQDTSPTSCGYASPETAYFSTPPQPVLICAPAAGCAQPYQTIDVGVGYGAITATLSPGVVSFGPVTSYPGDEQFSIDAVAPGSGYVRFQDPAESMSGSVTVTVLAAPENDGSFFVSGLASDGACDTNPFDLVFTSSAPVSKIVSSGSLVSISTPSVSGGLTTVTVTPTGQPGTMTLTATSGENALLIPLNIVACASPGEALRRQ